MRFSLNRLFKNNSSKSVATFIIGMLAIGILLYSGLMFIIVRLNLNSGLTDYFSKSMEDKATIVREEMLFSLEEAENTAKWIQQYFADSYEEIGYERATMNALATYAKEFFDAKNIVFFNKWGMQISSPKYGVVPKTPKIRSALEGEETVMFERAGDIIFGTVILPLKSNDEIFGVVEIRVPVSNDELLKTVPQYTGCEFAIFSDDIVTMTTLEALQDSTITNPEYLESSKAGNPVIVAEELDGQKYLSYYFPFNDQNGEYLTTILIAQKLDILTSVASKIFTPFFGAILLFTILLLVGFTLLIQWKVRKPLAKVHKAVANLSSGDADLTVRLNENGGDEFARLCAEVNKFIAMLQQIIIDLNYSQRTLQVVSENLGTNAQSSASATAQILANIESVRKQTMSQTKAVTNTTNVLEKSAQSMDILTDMIGRQSDGISNSSAAIEEMLGNISAVSASSHKMAETFKQLEGTVDNGNTKLARLTEKVNQIAEESEMLMQANSMISRIASETNLLAMNAAIEAAHAGDAGKGFSVVAEEIRKLAENSAVQSKNITSELKEISNSIQDVVDLSRQSQSAFVDIVEQISSTDRIINEIDNSMSEQEIASRQVFDSLAGMKNQSQEVSDKGLEVSKSILAVTQDMTSVNQISNTIQGSMDEMSTGMQLIGDGTQGVSELASRTKDSVEDMSGKLGQFKV